MKNYNPSKIPVQQVIVTSGNQFIIHADLPPGGYVITSSLNPKAICCGNEKYWGAYGARIDIKNTGKATIEEQEIVHYIKMTLLSPIDNNLVSEKRPTLRWAPVPGAVRYTVSWTCTSDRDICYRRPEVTTTQTQYTLEEDVEPSMTYEWGVDAYNKAGNKIAYYGDSTFRTTY